MLVKYQLSSAQLSLSLSVDGLETRPAKAQGENKRPMVLFDDGSGATLFVAVVVCSAGASYTRLQKWDGEDWQQVGPILDGAIHVLFPYLGELYAGGDVFFTPSLANLAKWVGDSWQSVGTGATPDGAVETIAEHEGRLYVGGAFTHLGNRPADHFARWDGVTWQGLLSRERALRSNALPSPLKNTGRASSPGPLPGLVIYDVKRHGYGRSSSWIAAAGQGVLQWDGRGWQKIAAILFGEARALAPWRGHLYAAATSEIRHPHALTSVYGQLARWGGQGWQAIPNAPAGPLYALAAGPDGKLYVGGSFERAGKIGAANIACWDGKTWSRVGKGLPGRVNALTVHQGTLYAGGDFAANSHASTVHNAVAKWDGQTWQGLRRKGEPEGSRSGNYRFDMASLLPRQLQEAGACL